MDGLRRVTLRVEHDCPLAELSRRLPDARLRAWSGHRFEVVELQAARWPEAEAEARRLLRPTRVMATGGGGIVVWHPETPREESLTRRLESYDLMWQQPMRAAGGWEHYDAISFSADGEQRALDDLRRDHPTQVVRRQTIGVGDVAASLFLSLQPLLDAPTAKQAEALLAAGDAGYYESPRQATTGDVAARLGIGRSAFEERLRGGENRVMKVLLPALRWGRGGPQAQGRT